MTQYVTHERVGLFVHLTAVQSDGRLSWQLASVDEVEGAVRELKRQIDVAAARAKIELQRHVPLTFGEADA